MYAFFYGPPARDCALTSSWCRRILIFLLILFSSKGYSETVYYSYAPPSDSIEARQLLARADSFFLKAEYLQATDITVLVLDYYVATKNSAGQIFCLNRLGDIFRGSRNFPVAREHLNMALKLGLEHHDSLGIATSENLLAALLFEQGPEKFDSCEMHARKSLTYARRHQLQKLVYYNLNILAMIASAHGDNSSALVMLEEAYPILLSVNPDDEPLLLTNMARVLFRTGNYAKAEHYGLKAFALAKKKKIVWYTIMSAQFLGNLYHVTKRDQDGYPILQELIQQLVLLQQESTEIKIREMKARKVAAQKEKENETLRISQSLLSQKAKQRQLLQILFGLLLLLSVVFILILLRQKRRLTAANEKLAQANTTLQTFISIIAHDLKNPLNSILGFTDILLHDAEKIDPEERTRALNYTNRAALAAFKLLEQLLEWARIQTGIIKADPQKILLPELLQEVLSTVQPMAVLKEQQIICPVVGEMNCFADRNMTLTLFRNLLSNAVKFTPHQGVITISAVPSPHFITISISDNGNGMAQEQLDGLFRMDKQIRTKGTDGEAGTGLGLLLCKEYADKNHGKIRVESRLGEGSTFHVTLPLSK